MGTDVKSFVGESFVAPLTDPEDPYVSSPGVVVEVPPVTTTLTVLGSRGRRVGGWGFPIVLLGDPLPSSL